MSGVSMMRAGIVAFALIPHLDVSKHDVGHAKPASAGNNSEVSPWDIWYLPVKPSGLGRQCPDRAVLPIESRSVVLLNYSVT